jgi:hypothetical protein
MMRFRTEHWSRTTILREAFAQELYKHDAAPPPKHKVGAVYYSFIKELLRRSRIDTMRLQTQYTESIDYYWVKTIFLSGAASASQYGSQTASYTFKQRLNAIYTFSIGFYSLKNSSLHLFSFKI